MNTLSEIEKWLKEHAINNYLISEDFYITVQGNVNLNKKQRFGSQVTYNEFGQAIPVNGLIDSMNVEKLRLEFELPSFKEYYNEMTEMHFEMNKETLIKRGIHEPQLYK